MYTMSVPLRSIDVISIASPNFIGNWPLTCAKPASISLSSAGSPPALAGSVVAGAVEVAVESAGLSVAAFSPPPHAANANTAHKPKILNLVMMLSPD